MEDKELQELWKASERQLQEAKLLNSQSWVLLNQVFVEMQQQKAKKKLTYLIISKLLAVVIGIAFIWFIGCFLYNYPDRLAVVISTSAIILITGAVVIDYMIQLYLLCTLNFHESIVKSQKQLAYIETSIIRSSRISFLQLPFYTFFYINHEVMAGAATSFWIFQLFFTGIFVVIALFFFTKISPQNLHKKWVRKMVDDIGGKAIRNAMEFMNEIKEFQNDLIPTKQV